MGVVLFATLAVIVLNLIVDLFYTAIDPRSRLRGTDFEGSAASARRPRRAQRESGELSVSQPTP
jgi:hypothetical protein